MPLLYGPSGGTQFLPVPGAAAQASWTVDAVNGNDNNAGTPAAPLKTMAELERRIGYRTRIDIIMDINVVGDLPTSDPIRFPFTVGESGLVRYHGQATNLYTSGAGFTARTLQARATQTPGNVTDTALGATTWTSLMTQNARIRTTGGTNPQSLAWPIKDLGANAARVSQWAIPTTAQPVPATFAETTVAVGDAFVVEKFSKALLQVDPAYTSGVINANLVQATFDGFDFSAGNQNDIRCWTASIIGFFGCTFGVTNFSGPGSWLLVCSQLKGAVQVRGGLVFCYEGAILGDVLVVNGAQFWADYDTIAQGIALCRSRLGGAVRIGAAASFDSAADGLNTLDGIVRVESVASGVIALWGNNATGYGIRCDAGKVAFKTGNRPTITGLTNDTIVAGAAKAYAAIPFFDAGNGAGIVVLP